MKLLLLTIAAFSLISCSSGPHSPLAPATYAKSSAERQIQRAGTMNMKARSLKNSSDKSIALVSNHKARITSSNLSENNYRAQIRVPATSLAPLMDSLSSIGKVTSKQVNMSDVTLAYLDLQATLKNKRALRDRLRTLLSRASKVEDTLKIEKELSRIQTELDQMEARMKTMQSKVTHSTLDLSIQRQRIPGPLGAIKDSTSWALSKLFYLN